MDKFSSKEKIRAIRRYLEGTEGGKTIAKSIDVHPSMLYQWIKQYESLPKIIENLVRGMRNMK